MTTPNLQLVEVPEAILTASDELNESLWDIDALLHLSVLSDAVASPPASPQQGDRYIIPAGATGAWSGRTNHIAYRGPQGWRYLVPRPGWRCWIRSGTPALYVFEAGAWSVVSGGGGGGVGSVKQQKATWARGAGLPIQTPINDVAVYFHEAATIAGVVLLGHGGNGSAVVDLWKTPLGTYPPDVSDSICGGNKPTLSATDALLDTTLTGWTLAVVAGDVIIFHLESSSTFTTLHAILLLE